MGREEGFLLLLLLLKASFLKHPVWLPLYLLGSGSHPKSWFRGGEHRG